MKPLALCLATQNRHKVDELRALLELQAPDLAAKLTLHSLAELGVVDEVVEDGDSFEANALIKAQAAHQRTGLWALADDSGLEVAALGGAPGIYSARYGGEPTHGESRDARNRQALQSALREVPAAECQARFVCVLCLYGQPTPDAAISEQRRRGECSGHIELAARGHGGFGYDPLFVPNPDELRVSGLPESLRGQTLAELPDGAKNRLSHRTRAVAGMLDVLRALVSERPIR